MNKITKFYYWAALFLFIVGLSLLCSGVFREVSNEVIIALTILTVGLYVFIANGGRHDAGA